MSRDVAYRNGYLPLFAGAELVRRSGSLTQFPADSLIGTLPVPPDCSAYVVYSTPRPDAAPEGAQVGMALYPYVEDVYRTFLAADHSQCETLVDAVDNIVSTFGAFPFVPEGYATPDIADPDNWRITLDDPGVAGGIGVIVQYVQGGVIVNAGTVSVSKTPAGVITVNTASLGFVPATFSTGGMQQLSLTMVLTVGAVGTFWPTFNAHLAPTSRAWVQCVNGGACAPTNLLWSDYFIGESGGEELVNWAPTSPAGGAYSSDGANVFVDHGAYASTFGTFTTNMTSPVTGGATSKWTLTIPKPACAVAGTCAAQDDFYLDVADADGNILADGGFSVYISGAGSSFNAIVNGNSVPAVNLWQNGDARLRVTINGTVATCEVLDFETVVATAVGTCPLQAADSIQRGVFGVRRIKASQYRGEKL